MKIGSNAIKFISLAFTSLALQLNAQDKKQYFAQEVNNKINVTLDDVDHILRGNIDIEYVNNSDDTLRYIYFHLWPRAYSSDRSAFNKQQVENGKTDFYLAPKNDWGTIDSISFTVNNIPTNIAPTEDIDVVKLLLPIPLYPKESIQIFTPFKVIIPKTFSRKGHVGQSYQITQWYPKPAVYDKNGWHPMPYLDQGEFYSEFGTFDVSITLPDNYVVMATGDLQNTSEIEWMNQKAKNPAKDTVDKNYNPPSSPSWKTLHFKEKNIHDFAWFADKRWNLKKKNFTIATTGKSIEAISAYYPWHGEGWERSADYLELAVQEYSKLVGPYIYNTVKAVEGPLTAGGGMEYPTVTIIIPSNDSDVVRDIIVHEVGHNWFYGMIANNERENPWLDESINTFVENGIKKQYFNETKKDFTEIGGNLGFFMSSSMRQNQPLNLHSAHYRNMNYGIDLYRRGALSFNWLKSYLGEEKFWSAMRNYYEVNKLKHVTPDNFYQSFSTTKNIDWFYKDLLNSNGMVDFSIMSIKNVDNKTFITIKNNTSFAAPAVIDIKNRKSNDSNEIKQIVTEPFRGTTTISIDNNGINYDEGVISKNVPDVNPYNNHYYNGKTFHPRWTILPQINPNNYYAISTLPYLGYNHHDGLQIGALINNYSVPFHAFQFAVAPAYGFKSRNIIGTGFLSYKQFLDNAIHHIEYKISAKSYGNKSSKLNIDRNLTSRYYKIAPEVIISFRTPNPRTPVFRELSMKMYWIGEEQMIFDRNNVDSIIKPHLGGFENNIYGKLKYQYSNQRTFNPYSYTVESQFNKNFIKLMLEGSLNIDYHYKKSGLNIRGFVGKFFDLSNDGFSNSRYYLNSTYGNYSDYLYDEVYIGRHINSNIWTHQISMREGGLKIPTYMYINPLGRSNDWLGSINLTSDIPHVPLVKVFADIATFSNASLNNPSGAKFLYDAGLEVALSDFFKVYIPIVYSKDYKEYLQSIYGKKAWLNAITFSINLNHINWSNLMATDIVRKMMK